MHAFAVAVKRICEIATHDLKYAYEACLYATECVPNATHAPIRYSAAHKAKHNLYYALVAWI